MLNKKNTHYKDIHTGINYILKYRDYKRLILFLFTSFVLCHISNNLVFKHGLLTKGAYIGRVGGGRTRLNTTIKHEMYKCLYDQIPV